MVDSIYRTRSLGVAAEGLPDQYADGKAAKVWEYYIGCRQDRTSQYKLWLTQLLSSNGCKSVLDVACGTGVDSIVLLEEGFKLVSTDASDKMLKYALKERWNRRKEGAFDEWIIEEANWLTLTEDLEDHDITEKFDAVLCLGNSFAHLPDFHGQQAEQKQALENFYAMVKPGGILVVDHRNYDEILTTGLVPTKNVYYNSNHIVDIKTSNLYVNSEPRLVTLDYVMDMGMLEHKNGNKQNGVIGHTNFRLSYYPHRLDKFSQLLEELFDITCQHEVYGDFKTMGEVTNPAYYIHVIRKPLL